MKKLLLSAIILFSIQTVYAQPGKIDLSKDPAKPSGTSLPKDNATLLKQSTPEPGLKSADPATQYKPDAASTGTITGSTVVAPDVNTTSPGAGSLIMNSTTNQYPLGNGVKANNTMIYDDAGKIRSSGTSIEFGKKKK